MKDATTKPLTEQELLEKSLVQMFSSMEKSGIGFDSTIDINSRTKQAKKRLVKRWDIEQVETWLEDPTKYAKELRDLSLYLVQSNTLYYRAVNYMATMPLICPVLIPNQVSGTAESMRNSYLKSATYLDILNLPHEMVKVFETLFTEAVFYGIESQEGESYYIKKLNPDYCQITRVVDGAYSFNFDMSFFDNDNTKLYLPAYCEIWSGFKRAYKNYQTDKIANRWVAIPSEISVCFKMGQSTEYSIPPFVSVFADLCNVEDYKALNKISTEQANYQLLGLEMETNSKSDKPNDFTVSTDVVLSFYNMIANGLPKGVGTFVTPVPAKPIKFEKRTGDINQVANATSSLYDSLGLASVLFAGASNAGTLKYSTKVDEALIFGIYRQIERWVNRKMKFANLDYHVKLLDITVFSKNDVQAELLKLAQASIPVKSHLASSIGLSPLDMINSAYLETSILDFENNWKPLATSHTQSSASGEAGREEMDEAELSDSGSETRDRASNENREGAL